MIPEHPETPQLQNYGRQPEQVGCSVVVYEPEWTIGAPEPASSEYISSTCTFIREWIEREYGQEPARAVRIIYGGGVSSECLWT